MQTHELQQRSWAMRAKSCGRWTATPKKVGTGCGFNGLFGFSNCFISSLELPQGYCLALWDGCCLTPRYIIMRRNGQDAAECLHHRIIINCLDVLMIFLEFLMMVDLSILLRIGSNDMSVANDGNGANWQGCSNICEVWASGTSGIWMSVATPKLNDNVSSIPIQHRHSHGWKWVTTNAHANN